MANRCQHHVVRASALLALCFGAAAEAMPSDYTRAVEQLSRALQEYQNLAQRMTPYDVVFRRDPMQPLVNEQGELMSSSGLSSGYAVQGIIWSDERPLVVIDDELYPAGATVGPYVIVQVLPDGVMAQRGEDKAIFIPLDRGLSLPQEHPAAASAPATAQRAASTPSEPPLSIPADATPATP